jgi:hypothetical protein
MRCEDGRAYWFHSEDPAILVGPDHELTKGVYVVEFATDSSAEVMYVYRHFACVAGPEYSEGWAFYPRLKASPESQRIVEAHLPRRPIRTKPPKPLKGV